MFLALGMSFVKYCSSFSTLFLLQIHHSYRYSWWIAADHHSHHLDYILQIYVQETKSQMQKYGYFTTYILHDFIHWILFFFQWFSLIRTPAWKCGKPYSNHIVRLFVHPSKFVRKQIRCVIVQLSNFAQEKEKCGFWDHIILSVCWYVKHLCLQQYFMIFKGR